MPDLSDSRRLRSTDNHLPRGRPENRLTTKKRPSNASIRKPCDRKTRPSRGKLHRRLADAGFAVWGPDSVLPGDNWASAAGKALNSSELMVVLYTRDGRGSANVTRDLQFC